MEDAVDIVGLILAISTMVLLIATFVSLAYISNPPKPRRRLKFKCKEGITLPETCVITGKPATEAHDIRGFTGSPYYIEMTSIKVLFSENGWNHFRKRYPISLAIFKGGLKAFLGIPIFGGIFAIYFWTTMVGPIFGIIAFVELFFKKRQLIVPLGVTLKDQKLTRIDLNGVHDQFLLEFLRVNGNISFEEYVASRRKEKIVFWILIALLIAFVILVALLPDLLELIA